MKKILRLSIVFLICSINGFGQITTRTHTVNYAVNSILELDFDVTATNLAFTFATANDFELGKTNASAAGFRVRSNKAWTVSVKANTANFTFTTGGEAVLANKLSVKRNGASSFIALNTSDQTLTTGVKGGYSSNTFQIDYFANPGYVAPATYSMGVTFTVTAP